MFEAIIALIWLSLMEIVLGIDNIVFISVATSKLPPEHQSSARKVGLALALGTRILLLCGIFWLSQLTSPVIRLSDWLPVESVQTLFTPGGLSLGHGEPSPASSEQGGDIEPAEVDAEAWEEFNEISWRDMILFAGGLFLIFSSVREIHAEVEGEALLGQPSSNQRMGYARVVIQIAVMDIIFSLDSVMTAVGMANQLWVMVAAIIVAIGVMIVFADQVGEFVEQNPTVKMLALNFLLLIGVMLVAEGIGTPISKGYIYFAMGFSLLVEMFNMRVRSQRDPPPSEESNAGAV